MAARPSRPASPPQGIEMAGHPGPLSLPGAALRMQVVAAGGLAETEA